MENENNLNPDQNRVDPSEDVDALSRESEDEQDEAEGEEQ